MAVSGAGAAASSDSVVALTAALTAASASTAAAASAASSAASSATSAATAALAVVPSKPSWASGSRPFDPRLHTYNLRPETLQRWRRGRALAEAGTGAAHVTCFLDSVTYGSGSSQPKWTRSIPGRLRALFDRRYGSAGSGVVVPWDTWFDTPADDPRLVKTGSHEKFLYGPHNLGAVRFLSASDTNYLEFTETCTSFVIYGLSGGSRPRISVDGGADAYIAGSPNLDVSLTDYDPQPGYQSNGSSGQIVTVVPAGSLGPHTLRIKAPSNGANHCVVFGVEARTGVAGVRVSSMARPGIKSSSLVADDAANYLSGMACSLDAMKADVAVMNLSMNDFNMSEPVATFKANVLTAVARQRSSATNKANGDVLLVLPAQPSYTLTPPITDYYRAMYEVADEQNVALLDVAARWVDNASAASLGWWADGVHPNDAGAADVAAAIFNALTAV